MPFANRFPKHKMMLSKRNAYDRLKEIALESNGTIFGGFVRDEYIAEYYTRKYQNTYSNQNNARYWDATHEPETKARMLIPKDIDISFKTQEEASAFITAVKLVPEFHEVWISESMHNYHNLESSLQSIQHVHIDMYYGREPFVSKGRVIPLDIDVVVPIDNKLEPPFNNLDMLCNGFIMTKEGKRFSKNTGTIIDLYSDYERAVVTPQILHDLVNFKTYISMTNAFVKQTINISAFNRVNKMKSKKTPWTILNMPYAIEKYGCSGCLPNEEPECCCICSTNLGEGEEVAYTKLYKDDFTCIPSAKVHNHCMIKYITHQVKTFKDFKFNNPGKVFCFKCPMRNSITFTRCKLDIQFAYKTDL